MQVASEGVANRHIPVHRTCECVADMTKAVVMAEPWRQVTRKDGR
jgi:hypothetical protein